MPDGGGAAMLDGGAARRVRRPVAILGATGVAGTQALAVLSDHPWFEVTRVASSSRTAGRRLGEVVDVALPAALADRILEDGDDFDPRGVDVVFSMLPSSVAARIESRCAATTPVVSTAAAFRDEADTPLLLAGVNPGHAEALRGQARARGWRGFVAPNPNCTTVGLAVTLAPLVEAFGVSAAVVTSLQAVSGAGADGPRIADLVEGNVLPWIEGEEEKVERECAKILGRLAGDVVEPASLAVSATCTRVPVEDGHTLSVAAALASPASADEVTDVLRRADPWAGRDLPSAPARWIDVREEPDRPQPRRDRAAGGGMTTVVGRVRPDPVLGGVKYVVVSHNAVMGAAGGAVLLAEDLVDRGFLD